MKGNRLLFGIVVVLLMMISVLPGCNEGQPAEVNKLVIPSSLIPVEVFKEVAITDSYSEILPLFDKEWVAGDIDPYITLPGAGEEQFIEGYGAAVPEVTYTMRDGKRAGWGYTRLVIEVFILKFENSESAERSFINISETNGFQNLTYEGITLKNGTYTLPWWQEESEGDYWDNFTMPCYLIHSGCFVIYYYGREDVLSDMLDRIIATFGVK